MNQRYKYAQEEKEKTTELPLYPSFTPMNVQHIIKLHHIDACFVHKNKNVIDFQTLPSTMFSLDFFTALSSRNLCSHLPCKQS